VENFSGFSHQYASAGSYAISVSVLDGDELPSLSGPPAASNFQFTQFRSSALAAGGMGYPSTDVIIQRGGALA
jgi:hypothetical protein